jgi:hypothetical protein
VPHRSCAPLALWLLAQFVAGAACRAQELEPRTYANAPVGLNFLIAGYTYSEGGVVVDPSIPLDNAQISLHSSFLAFARSFGIAGRSAKLDVVAPYTWLSGTADVAGQPRARDASGWADPRLRVSINLFGAPAMSLQEIAAYRQDLIIGASVQVWVPAGRYDADKVVNLGANRWAIKPELGLSKAVGRWTFELAAAVAFYGDNDEYLIDRTREQEPIYSAQGAIICSLRPDMWVALGGTYYAGGRTQVDGIEGDDLQENSRFGVVLALPIGRHNSVKLYANTGISTRTGNDFDSAGLAWQYRWGGGL